MVAVVGQKAGRLAPVDGARPPRRQMFDRRPQGLLFADEIPATAPVDDIDMGIDDPVAFSGPARAEARQPPQPGLPQQIGRAHV